MQKSKKTPTGAFLFWCLQIILLAGFHSEKYCGNHKGDGIKEKMGGAKAQNRAGFGIGNPSEKQGEQSQSEQEIGKHYTGTTTVGEWRIATPAYLAAPVEFSVGHVAHLLSYGLPPKRSYGLKLEGSIA